MSHSVDLNPDVVSGENTGCCRHYSRLDSLVIVNQDVSCQCLHAFEEQRTVPQRSDIYSTASSNRFAASQQELFSQSPRPRNADGALELALIHASTSRDALLPSSAVFASPSFHSRLVKGTRHEVQR
jgi:hypothetical protein